MLRVESDTDGYLLKKVSCQLLAASGQLLVAIFYDEFTPAFFVWLPEGFLAVFHYFPDAAAVRPAGALPDIEDLGQFMGGYFSFGGIHQEDHVEGFIDVYTGIVQNGIGRYGLLITTFGAAAAV